MEGKGAKEVGPSVFGSGRAMGGDGGAMEETDSKAEARHVGRGTQKTRLS